MKKFLILVGATLGFSGVAAPAWAQYTATVNAKVQSQTFEGFGTSLSWWANAVGSWPEPTRSALVDALFAPAPLGLGLTYARYNIGGGDNPNSDRKIVYPHAVPGYQPDINVKFDWTADFSQRWVAQRAYANGAVFLEAQSNSPPWWMTVSQRSTGNIDPTKSNIYDNYTGDGPNTFPNYLATVVRHFDTDFGLTFRHVEATNEPEADWWKKRNTKQEGASITPGQQETINESLAWLMRTDSPQSQTYSPKTTVAAMDANDIDKTLNILNGYTTKGKAAITQINTHTYNGTSRTQLAAAAAAAHKRLVVSEWGAWDATGKELSQQITKDLRELKPLAWAIWQPDWPNLMTIDYANHSYQINKNYYIYANYTRYIQPGSVFIDINDSNSVATHDGRSKTLTIVTTNWSTASIQVTYPLSNFTHLGHRAHAHGHRTSSSENLVDLAPARISGNAFTASLPAGSVTTWVIPNIDYSPTSTSYNDKHFTYSRSDCGHSWCTSGQPGAYDGQNSWSSKLNSHYALTFTGTQARVHGAFGPNQGIAAYSVDDGAETDVDLYAATRADNQLTYVTPTLPPGTHRIKVRVTGLKNFHSSGTIVPADRIDIVP